MYHKLNDVRLKPLKTLLYELNGILTDIKPFTKLYKKLRAVYDTQENEELGVPNLCIKFATNVNWNTHNAPVNEKEVGLVFQGRGGEVSQEMSLKVYLPNIIGERIHTSIIHVEISN